MKITDIKKVFGRRAVQVRIACLPAIAVIAFLVVKYDVRTETKMKCLLTGSDRVVTTRFGFSSDVVSRNEVSRWAERYGNPEITPGLCGWQTVGSSTKRWFVPTINGVHASPRNVVNVLHDRSLHSADEFEGRLLKEFYRQISTKRTENDHKLVGYILENYLSHCPPMIVPDARAMTISCFYQDQLSPPPPQTFEVPNAKRREAVVTSLRDLRWIPTSLNPSRTVSFVPPDFDLLLTDNTGKLHTYHFYWRDGIVGNHDGRVAENLQQLRDQVTLITGLSSRPKVPPASE